MIQSLLANFDSFWFILTQVPGALQAAINIYERNPALAVFAFVGVFLACVAKQLVAQARRVALRRAPRRLTFSCVSSGS